MPEMPDDLYFIDPDDLQAEICDKARIATAKVWKCNCSDQECESRVVYGRGSHDGRIYFACTWSSMPSIVLVTINNVEDLWQIGQILPQMDADVYAAYLKNGLKQALLSA